MHRSTTPQLLIASSGEMWWMGASFAGPIFTHFLFRFGIMYYTLEVIKSIILHKIQQKAKLDLDRPAVSTSSPSDDRHEA